LIIGEIEQLLARNAVSSTFSKSIGNIRSNSNHILQLVNELLDFRKLEAEELKLKMAEGNLVKFAKEIFLAFQNQAESKGISYSFKSQTDSIQVWYDRDQLEKVLYNLLSNAFKYTPAGQRIDMALELTPNEVVITVSDTGKGITQDQLPNVFTRFYQTDNAPKALASGFGIGLSIVKEIVELHHGEVNVESELGQGTSFRVKLPLGTEHLSEDQMMSGFLDSESIQLYQNEPPLAPPSPSQESSENPISEELLLIVEDNDHIREFIAEVLGRDFKVVTAGNGVEALEAMESELPDLIIADVMMPEMDGITLTQKVKSSVNTSHIPVILLTARTGLIFKKEGFEQGADDYINKPFNSLMLGTRVKNILQNRQLLREKLRNEFLTKPKAPDALTPDEAFLINITQIMDDHLDSPDLGAPLISTELGMSHSVVYKKIKALTGQTLVEFVREYRLSQAADLLTSFQFSVADACYRVGFSDKKYFGQVFKKKYGVSPSEYAKASRKAGDQHRAE
jgi:DNA-binding response OmpR family regulator